MTGSSMAQSRHLRLSIMAGKSAPRNQYSSTQALGCGIADIAELTEAAPGANEIISARGIFAKSSPKPNGVSMAAQPRLWQ